ncbi:MAG: phospholipase D-like domain-containing protein [Opitutaceae bacterium]|nr:phospholipase D-like domain-containing protein [Opitutaceae bacterium]
MRAWLICLGLAGGFFPINSPVCAQNLTPATAAAAVPLARYLLAPLPELELPAGLEVHFAPQEDLEQLLVRAIDGARQEILVNHYLITSPALLAALGRAVEQKKVVLVLLDAAPAVRDYQGFTELRRRQVPFVPVRRASGRWNNNKYLIIDRARVLVGTADLTPRIALNDEEIMAFEEPSVVIAFYNHFVRSALGAEPAPAP